LNAGLIYNSFPLMGEGIVPADYGELLPFHRNFFENLAAVQFNHRLLAITTLIATIALWFWGRRVSLAPEAHRALDLIALAALLQVGLGIATLLLVVPVSLGVAHQGGAILVLTAVIWAHRQLPREPS
jgi:cytochrome c oxidase assembly protein subunit 15